MTSIRTCWMVLGVLTWSACDLEATEDDELPGRAPGTETNPATILEPAALTMPVADLCDDPSYANVEWSVARSSHFAIYYLPGTAADHDQGEIATRLEAAYERIRGALEVAALPVITVYLSPNRQAAASHGRSYGRAFFGQDRYEVIYTGAPDSYELQRYGHELTHIFEYYVDDLAARHHPLLSEGLAEYLDLSGRDMHEAYALQLLAGAETRVRVATFDARDVTASNYGRAGSLVQFLIERYGMPKFREILRATTVTWNNGCWTQPAIGCITTPTAVLAMLDGALVASVGESWATAQVAWEAAVQRALSTVDVSLPSADEKEIRNLIRVMDLAMTTGDAATYRSTMDGFYCEPGTDALRDAIAWRAVTAFSSVSSQVEAIYPTGIRNFRTAQVLVRRRDARGLPMFSTVYVEHFPAGWRMTYGADWY